mmetsp:Transcript_36300/g.107174  ORF Transcript_36300/g.107174 Transcript_36300/m.107174 type:complete len:231 (-) Transcript_36300:66-758(-)
MLDAHAHTDHMHSQEGKNPGGAAMGARLCTAANTLCWCGCAGAWSSAHAALASSRSHAALHSHLRRHHGALHLEARRRYPLHHGLHRLRGQVLEVHQAVVCPDLKVLARVLVHVRRAQHAENLPPRWQHDRALKLNAGGVRHCANLLHGVAQQHGGVAAHAHAQLDRVSRDGRDGGAGRGHVHLVGILGEVDWLIGGRSLAEHHRALGARRHPAYRPHTGRARASHRKRP